MCEYLISVKNLIEESLNKTCDQAKWLSKSTWKAKQSWVTVCQRCSKALGPACLTCLSWHLWVHPSISNIHFIPFYRSQNDTMSWCDCSQPAARPHHHLIPFLLLVAQPIHIRLLCLIVSLSQNCLAITTSHHRIPSWCLILFHCHDISSQLSCHLFTLF